MTYEPSSSVIPRVFFVVDIGEEVMNIIQLVIQVLEPCCAINMVCILCHGQILELIENHFDNVVVDAIKLILLNYSSFNIAKIVIKKIERVK